MSKSETNSNGKMQTVARFLRRTLNPMILRDEVAFAMNFSPRHTRGSATHRFTLINPYFRGAAMNTMCALLMVLGANMGDDKSVLRVDFESGVIGKLPDGWTAARTGKGEGSVWKI